jgi:hypothetical protein
VVDVPARPEVVTLGGSPVDPPPAAAPKRTVAAASPKATVAAAPPPARSQDPFAPPDDAPDTPLVVVATRPAARPAPAHAPSATPASSAQEQHPFLELSQHKRAAEFPWRLGRRILIGLGAAVVVLAGLAYWNHSEPDPVAEIRIARSVVHLEALPEQAWVFVDGVRTFLNPVELPISQSRHELKIECPGYRTRVLTFTATPGEQTIDAHLERASARAATR